MTANPNLLVPRSAIAPPAIPSSSPEPLGPAPQTDTPQPSTAFQSWQIFGSTFITICLAELGDKTQLATLLMSAQSHSPWIVFAGAAAALISTSLIGVLVGWWLSQRLSARTLDRAAGVIMAVISVWLFWDVLHG